MWSAKTDRRLLRLCTPWTQKTHAARGFFVLTTSLFAFASAFYTLTTIADALIAPAVALSFLWASMIFMVDRELVGHWSRRSLWFRVALAMVLGATVAIPAEMRVLQGRIDQQITRQYSNENRPALDRLTERQHGTDKHQEDLQTQLTGLRVQAQETSRNLEAEEVGRVIANQTTGLAGKGPAYEAAQRRLDLLHGEMKDVEDEIGQLNTDRTRISDDFKRQEIGAVHDFPSRYEALDSATPIFSPMWKISWLVTLLFISFDMMPVLMKALSPVTDYDKLLSAQVQENIRRVQRLSDYNTQIAEKDFLTPQASTVELFERVFSSAESNAPD